MLLALLERCRGLATALGSDAVARVANGPSPRSCRARSGSMDSGLTSTPAPANPEGNHHNRVIQEGMDQVPLGRMAGVTTHGAGVGRTHHGGRSRTPRRHGGRVQVGDGRLAAAGLARARARLRATRVRAAAPGARGRGDAGLEACSMVHPARERLSAAFARGAVGARPVPGSSTAPVVDGAV